MAYPATRKRYKNGHPRMTEAKYRQLKAVFKELPTDVKIGKASEILGISASTAKRIITSKDYAEYKALTVKTYNKAKQLEMASKATAKVVVNEEPTFTNTVDDSLFLKRLDRIANAIERLADAWDKAPEKKGWLK